MPPTLVLDAERRPLRPGDNILGGSGAGAVALAALASTPPAAVISVRGGAPVEIRRLTAGVVVRVDGEALGAAPRELRHGARLEIGSFRLRYEDPPPPPPPPPPPAPSPAPMATDSSAAATQLSIPAAAGAGAAGAPAGATASARARLVEVATGRSFPVSDGGATIGRGVGCDVVLATPGISRLHATIAPAGPGFVVRDESANGTYVNGARVAGARPLAHGDVLRLDVMELRFELAEPAAGAGAAAAATQVLAADSPLARLRSANTAAGAAAAVPASPTPASGQPLATLTVTRGALAGSAFPIVRPVCAVGRGEQNDVRLLDDSVSSSHATLLRKRDAWYVVDLRSANGTFVDGSRIAGERALAAGAMLRMGNVEMTFRPAAGVRTPEAGSTQNVGGLLRRLGKLLGGGG